MYSAGQVFLAEGGKLAILAQTHPRKVCMVCLSDGNRYADPVKVGHPRAISEDEFLQVTDGFEFKLLPAHLYPYLYRSLF